MGESGGTERRVMEGFVERCGQSTLDRCCCSDCEAGDLLGKSGGMDDRTPEKRYEGARSCAYLYGAVH